MMEMYTPWGAFARAQGVWGGEGGRCEVVGNAILCVYREQCKISGFSVIVWHTVRFRTRHMSQRERE